MTSPDRIAAALEELRAGGVIGLPTETVYGLAADAGQPAALRKVFQIKGRPADHPLILHLAEAEWLKRYCRDVPSAAWKLAEGYWPGPLSMILNRSALVPDEVTGGRETVAVRVPSHPVALAVLRGLGSGLAAPSANRFGEVSPTTAAHVRQDFGEEVPCVLDGGASEVGLESTILDLSTSVPRLLRPGGISPEELSRFLGEEVLFDDGSGPAAPGMLESHYSPAARVTLLREEELPSQSESLSASGRRVGVLLHSSLLQSERLAKWSASLESDSGVILERLGEQQEQVAKELYSALRRLDEAGCDDILTVLPGVVGIGRAVADRLIRAAADSGK